MLRLLLLISVFGISQALFATTYYIDAVDGNDANSGQSALAPWQSLDKVNNSNFLPGDRILFKKNSVWFGGLNIHSAGSAANPIVFSTYGAGAKPLINGGGTVQAAIFIHNSASYTIVDGFAVTNFDGLDVFDGAEDLRCGIQVGTWSGTLTDVHILNNEVYFVEGCSNHHTVGAPRGSTLNPDVYNLYQNAGIFCHASNMDNLTISGNYVHDCTCTGIFAFQFENALNLLVRQNSVYNVGADGIVILHATSPLIELNACINAGNNSGANPRLPGELGSNGLAVAGIWSTECSDPVFQYNYCEGTKRITWDGQAWDFDNNTTGNALYQYNYSRDNEGGFNLGGTPNQFFRYNISYNDGAKQGNAQAFFNGSPTYSNNVFYRTDGKAFLLSQEKPQQFLNNIFFTATTDDIIYQDSDHTFSNNCFYGHTPISPGTNPVLTDPLFLNPVAPGKILPGVLFTIEDLRNAVAGFLIDTESGCTDAGAIIPNYATADFWGNPFTDTLPDIGIHEILKTPNASAVPDEKNEQIAIFPNPANHTLNIPGKWSDYSIEIMDVHGCVYLALDATNEQLSIDISGLPAGMFFVKFLNRSSQQLRVRKFLKTN